MTIADFKSGAGGEARRQAEYEAQLRLYRAALAPLYPGRKIRCWLVWLDGPHVVEIE